MEKPPRRAAAARGKRLIHPEPVGRVAAEWHDMAEAERLIEVENLTRRFPRCEALGDVSFQVRRGEIAGILGPNGSGKTTTLRILAAYLAPTSGRVRGAGFETATHSLEVRRRIGYLPENVPLYPEMRVDEFLAFRGRLRGLRGAKLSARLREVIDELEIGWRLRHDAWGRGYAREAAQASLDWGWAHTAHPRIAAWTVPAVGARFVQAP